MPSAGTFSDAVDWIFYLTASLEPSIRGVWGVPRVWEYQEVPALEQASLGEGADVFVPGGVCVLYAKGSTADAWVPLCCAAAAAAGAAARAACRHCSSTGGFRSASVTCCAST